MGCDIHSILEILTTETEGEGDNEREVTRWRAVHAPVFDSPYFDPARPRGFWNCPGQSEPLSSRNYRLFAMLADVRNGRGFAGVDTGDRVEPIDAPRGVPLDASPEWHKEVADWDSDMHSHSYFTLTELEAYDWDGLVFERGYLAEEDYLRLRGAEPGTSPETWSGFIQGPGIISLTAAEYEALTPEGLASLKAGRFDAFPEQVQGRNPFGPDTKWIALRPEQTAADVRIVVQHTWAETRRQNMGQLEHAMKVMVDMAPKPYDAATHSFGQPDHDRIRICFGFDN